MTPEVIPQHDMEARFHGGPELGKSAVLVLTGGRIYKREGNVWRRLDNAVTTSAKETT